MIEDKYKELETERLMLRKITDIDAKMLYQNIFNNFDWYKFYYQVPFKSLGEYQDLVSKYKEWYLNGNHFRWGIVEKNSNEMIGAIHLHSKDTLNNNCKIGYIISYRYNKQGYAKEAVEKILDFAFQELKFHRVEADIVVENIDSIHLAESLDMQFESIKHDGYKLEDKYYDEKVYTMIR